MQEIIRTDITTEEQLDREIVKTSKANPTKYLTYFVTPNKHWGTFKTWIFLHSRKPQSGTTGGAENTYRHHKGFFKNGKIIKPSNTFIKRYNFCPVSR